MLRLAAPMRSRLSFFAVLTTLLVTLFAGPALAGPNDGLPPLSGAPIDRATPRRSMSGFLEAAHTGNFARAAHFLDLRDVPRGQQAIQGPDLAQHLAYVLDRKMPADLAKLSDEPEGDKETAPSVIAGNVYVDDDPVPIALTRVKFDDGVSRWVIARSTVSMIGTLYGTFGPHGWEDRLPSSLTKTTLLGNAPWQWLGLVLLVLASYLVARVLSWVLVAFGRRLVKHTQTAADDRLIEAARRPMRIVLLVLFFRQLVDDLHLSAVVADVCDHVGFTLLVIGIAWFVLGAIGLGTSLAEERLPSESQFDVRHRVIHTQLVLLRRIAGVIVIVVAIAVVLIQFEFVRNVGLSLLASAGLAGIVLGIAAQRSLAGIIAGIQLSVTQPIRLGDSVVVEKEFGVIEEINLTYVVVRLWDERRLVVPISRFLEQPFENWTRTNPQLTGTVTFAVDYATPVDKVRAELSRIVSGHPLWDKRLCSLQVTETNDKSIVLRAVVSAKNAGTVWDLRCDVREQLLAFLVALDGGKYLVKSRVAA